MVIEPASNGHLGYIVPLFNGICWDLRFMLVSVTKKTADFPGFYPLRVSIRFGKYEVH
jgi:hypothetical protein